MSHKFRHANADLLTHPGFGFNLSIVAGERYDFVINADQPVGAYWIQARGLGECGNKRVQQLGILRYARGPYQPKSKAPTYDVGLPQGVVSILIIIIPNHDISLCRTSDGVTQLSTQTSII